MGDLPHSIIPALQNTNKLGTEQDLEVGLISVFSITN